MNELNHNKTKFFYTITPDVILSTAELLGRRATGKILALNSLENRVYSVELDALPNTSQNDFQNYLVIKFYRPGRWSLEQIEEEHQFIKDLEAEGIAVISPINLGTGKTIHTIENFDGEGTNIYCAIYPRIAGRLLDELDNQKIEILGRLIARMHLVAKQKNCQHRVTLNAQSFALDNLEYLKANHFLPLEISTRFSDLTKTISDYYTDWTKNVSLQRVHGDLHHGNILWMNNELNLLDFDDFVAAPAVQDLWLLISGRDDYEKKQRDLLIDSYAEMIDFDFETIRLIEPLRALRMIHFSAWIAKRWEDPAFKHAFQNFNTAQYWREQLQALEEVLQIIQSGQVY